MPKVQAPLNLKRFKVVNSKKPATYEQVVQDLHYYLDYNKQQESLFFHSAGFTSLMKEFLSGTQSLPSGSANSWARSANIAPLFDSKVQTHNTKEMFRSSVTEKLLGHVQILALVEVLKTFTAKPSAKQVKESFTALYPHIKTPPAGHINTWINRVFDKGVSQVQPPQGAKVLKVYACDMHFCSKVEHDKQNGILQFSIKLPTSGVTTLEFRVPDVERFEDVDKFSRPTIKVDDKGNLLFCFVGIKQVQQVETSTVLGVDLGKVEPFVASAVNVDSKEYSAPYFTNRKVNKLVEQRKELAESIKHLKKKKDKNIATRRVGKVKVLNIEISRLKDKSQRLKREIATQIAVSICEIAKDNNAHVKVENLKWLGAKARYWNFAETQDKLDNKLAHEGLKLKRVSAAQTSQTCDKCGKSVKHVKRKNVCLSCANKVDRDVMASRIIALKGVKDQFLKSFEQKNLAGTRLSELVTLRSSATQSTDTPSPHAVVTPFEVKIGTVETLGKSSNCRKSKA